MSTTDNHAAVIRAVRALRGWHQKELAERMDMTPETLSRIESGRLNTQRYTSEVCAAAGLTLSEFDLLLDIRANSENRIMRAEITTMAEGSS